MFRKDFSSAHFAAMVLSADERRELRRLLDKMESADGVTESDAAAMTDGAKRLRDDYQPVPPAWLPDRKCQLPSP